MHEPSNTAIYSLAYSHIGSFKKLGLLRVQLIVFSGFENETSPTKHYICTNDQD